MPTLIDGGQLQYALQSLVLLDNRSVITVCFYEPRVCLETNGILYARIVFETQGLHPDYMNW